MNHRRLAKKSIFNSQMRLREPALDIRTKACDFLIVKYKMSSSSENQGVMRTTKFRPVHVWGFPRKKDTLRLQCMPGVVCVCGLRLGPSEDSEGSKRTDPQTLSVLRYRPPVRSVGYELPATLYSLSFLTSLTIVYCRAKKLSTDNSSETLTQGL